MSDPQRIEDEIKEYLEKEENLRRGDRLRYLMTIINKHFALDKIDHVVNYHDFQEVFDMAKRSYPGSTIPMFISKKEVHSNEINHILVLEAFIGYLNKHKLLTRLVKFDRRK